MNAKEIRIVYMGTPDFAVEPLRLLVEGGYNVVGVVTVPDKPAGRGLKVQESAVKRYATEHLPNVPVLQPEKLKDETWLRQFREELRPDLCIVVAFRMLPEVVWGWPRLGTFNLHASLLPDYRGAAPINWAVINGETKTGITTFFLNEEIDCGGIIDQREVSIGEEDTAGIVHDKLMAEGAKLVVDTVDQIASGQFEPRVQDCALASKPAPKIFKEDCKLDFTATVRTVYNKVRGLSPYPGAWCDFDGTTMKILQAGYEEANLSGDEIGKFDSDGKSFFRVGCQGGWLYIKRLQVAGKRAMDTDEFLRGYRFQ